MLFCGDVDLRRLISKCTLPYSIHDLCIIILHTKHMWIPVMHRPTCRCTLHVNVEYGSANNSGMHKNEC